MYTLKVKTHFDAAHHLVGYEGKCQRVHGHRWDVEASFQGTGLDALNMLIDFGTIKKALKDIIDDRLDHLDLNKSLHEETPTAEYLAEWIFGQLIALWHKGQLKLQVYAVTVWESPECSVTYSEESDARY